VPFQVGLGSATLGAVKAVGAATTLALAACVLLPGCTSSTQKKVVPTSTNASVRPSPPPPNTTLSPLAQCDPSALRLIVAVSGENTTVAVAAVLVTTRAPCRVTTEATLALIDTTGKLLVVHGNPATAQLNEVAGKAQQDSQFSNSFDWADWCGPRSPSPRLQVRLPALGLESTITPDLLPVSIGTSSGSTLVTIPS
jgi:hypothetical protein